MHTTTKLFALGAVGAATYGAARLLRKRMRHTDMGARFDRSDVGDISDIRDAEDAILVTEEVVVITDADDDADIDLIPSDDPRVRT
jgi:hypothetical protein